MQSTNVPAVESRVSTRAILLQLKRRTGTRLNLSHTKLNQREVGAYVVNGLQLMWLASDGADLEKLKQLLEVAFIEAYSKAGGVYDIATRKKLGMP